MFSFSFFLLATILPLSLNNPVVEGTTTKTTTTILDLSKDFEVGNLDSSGAKKVVDVVSQDFTRRFLVLEKGKIVVDYTREGCNTIPADPLGLCDLGPVSQWCKTASSSSTTVEICDVKPEDTFVLFSVSKSLDSLAFGLLVDAGLLTLDDTLGDIFTNTQIWENVTHAEYLRGVSIKELLTMTSGLTSYFDGSKELCLYEGLPPDSCVNDGGGKDLSDALNLFSPVPGTRGSFNYIQKNSVYSYIFLQLTGQGMREYMASNVFPDLGIDNNSIGWATNSDGVEASQSSMYLSAYDMAKFGQLYLQNGMSSPERSIVSADWVTKSTTPIATTYFPGASTTPQNSHDYGFMWYVYPAEAGIMYCAIGFVGQAICVNPAMERVFIRKSDGFNTFVNGAQPSDFDAFLSTTVFDEEEDSGEETEADEELLLSSSMDGNNNHENWNEESSQDYWNGEFPPPTIEDSRDEP